MSQQSRPEDIEYRLRLKWASEFQYTTREHAKEDVLADNYFHNLSQRYLMPGDLIHIAVISENGAWEKALLEVAAISSTKTKINMVKIKALSLFFFRRPPGNFTAS